MDLSFLNQANLGATAAKFGNIILIGVILVIFAAAIFGIWWFYSQNKKYKKYMCIIWKRHKNDSTKTEVPVIVGIDRGAYMKDKKIKKWVFHMRKANVDLGQEERESLDEDRVLDVPTVPLETGGAVVFVEKLGHKKYAVGQPFIVDGQVRIRVSNADLSEALRAYDINAAVYGKKTSWLGPAMFIICAVLVIVLIAVVLNKFEVLKEVSQNLIDAGKYCNGGGDAIVAA